MPIPEQYYRYIIDNSRDAITLIDREYRYELVNATFCEGLDNCSESIIGHTVEEVWGSEKFNQKIKGYIDRCFAGETVEYIEEFPFGPFLRYMHVTYHPYVEDGVITRAIVYSHDITHIGRLENRLYHYEYRDPLTGLFNRRSLDIILEKELDRTTRSERQQFGVFMLVRIEEIERAVEIYGQEYGDLLIENSGMRLQEKIRSSDYVFRYDGNLFAVLLSNIDNRSDAGNAAKHIHDTVTLPYTFRGHDIVLGCSVGAVVYPPDGGTKEELIRKATSAMLDSVQKGKKFTLYNRDLFRQALRRIDIESAAHRALEEGQFALHYQPIVDPFFNVVGAEALLRWDHPKLGSISPAEFIPLAERTELIFSLSKWIIFTVCRRLKEWSGRFGIYISLNLSSREFSSPQLIDNVKAALRSHGLPSGQHLKIEITENESLQNIEQSILRMRELETLGVEVFIDDFGTGHSSLQYLKRLPASLLKIDREFVAEIDTNSEEREFLTHIVHMALARGKKVLAEGVENRQQARLLVNLGCSRLQGFYFSRPVPAEKFESFLYASAPLPVTAAG